MPIDSIQSNVPSIPNTQDYIRQGSAAVQAAVLPPRLVTANGVALAFRQGIVQRFIQNCGTVPVKFLISKDPADLATTDMFHGILAACTSVDDGLGSVLDFSKVVGQISIFGDGGAPRVCTYQAVEPFYV